VVTHGFPFLSLKHGVRDSFISSSCSTRQSIGEGVCSSLDGFEAGLFLSFFEI